MSASTCTDSQLVPNVAELLVSQGAPGYARLARSKETIVRAYLTNPTTCTVSSRQSITPISATLSTANGDTGIAAPTPLTTYQPLSGKLGAASQIYSTSDPFFVVPASYLAPMSTTNAFNITFTLKITYSRNGSSTYNTTTGTETNASRTVTVDQKTNALRVLVVPMGDPTSTNTQWSSTAQTTLQDLMTNAARAFPVPTGISAALCDPSATCPVPATGGIRYVVSTTVLDARSLGLYKASGGLTKFCANGSVTSGSWNTSQVTSGAYLGHTLKGDLLQRLADYNLTNAPPADLVLGVIDGANAWKSTDGLGCDDGRAATPAARAAGQVGWVRVSTDPTYPTPLQMELLHPFGESDQNLTFHSTNAEADGVEPDHGYNVLQRKLISTVAGALGTNDHSIMNYSTAAGAYTKDNTLLEPNDWGDALCNLGGVDSTLGPFANCTLKAALGTSQGVPAAAGRKFFQISGMLTGNNAAPVRVTMAKANVPSDVETGVVDTSRLHLLLCEGPCSTASNVRKDVGLALLRDEGHADGGAVSFGGANGFDAMVEMATTPPLWTDAALTLDGSPVFSSSKTDPPPEVTSTSTVAPGTVVRSFTPYFSDDGEFTSSLCCNGRAVAFDGTNLYLTVSSSSDSGDNQRIYKATTSDGRIVSSVPTGTSLGALAYDAGTGHLYGGDYTGNGNVYDINPSDGSKSDPPLFSFSDPGSCLFAGGGSYIDGLEYRPLAGNLALSGDACDHVYIKTLAGGDVSNFPTSHNSGITTDGAGGLWLARLETPTVTYTRLTHVDSSGTVLGELTIDNYEAEDLAYDSVTFAPTCVVWMNEATAGSPEVRAVAVPCGAAGGNAQAIETTTTNTKFASLFFTCGDPGNLTDDQPTFTIANGLRPDAAGTVVAEYTNQLFCGVGTPKIITEASNGWTSTGLNDPDAVQPVDAGTTNGRSPITNIASPLNGAKVRRGESVHYEGSATDAEQEAITGTNLKWYDDRLTPQLIGTGQSFDLRLAAASPLGDHHIRLEATDLQGHTYSTTVTITIGPALCPSTSKCP